MGVPASSEARKFYRCAYMRFEEAQVLLKASYTTGGVYLAGYPIECILKSLILATVPANARLGILKSFRGSKAHEFDWLRDQYLLNGGPRFTKEVTKHFTLVNDWSTDLRYSPRGVVEEDAVEFLNSADAIIRWANGRL
ncbi:HEPN domain-containing protein [Planctomicrobium piriforme]|uniref:HEPN domain-containing protein n=1 Tax=Planctomicrobium piriforme TaxID=1576369 RepID=A0A1I3LUH4_9PLAN|nr:HEPN domain-containing protein [Planctomicrobium piriforme]SFI88392.1 HEPN domain-containing protein [Planctomicrobium piriforme]